MEKEISLLLEKWEEFSVAVDKKNNELAEIFYKQKEEDEAFASDNFDKMVERLRQEHETSDTFIDFIAPLKPAQFFYGLPRTIEKNMDNFMSWLGGTLDI